MIDTDKYEGHTPAPWSYTIETEDKIWEEHGAVWDAEKTCLALVNGTAWSIKDEVQPDADLALIADAPLLLAEVKRLREEIKNYDACLQNLWDKELIPEDTDIWDEVKELLEA